MEVYQAKDIVTGYIANNNNNNSNNNITWNIIKPMYVIEENTAAWWSSERRVPYGQVPSRTAWISSLLELRLESVSKIIHLEVHGMIDHPN
jgi:hypothetical protein